ncbi:MAG TPA: hypothetical protein PLJ39_02050 [Spirochaetota bacterium]|nr:hypothetical protein [Spirochaetota bacterium]HPN29490.1 hypothetical protein [bacterium]HPN29511.1 hypothetical protein [bacterium]
MDTEEENKLTDKEQLRILQEWKRYLEELAPKLEPFAQIIYTRFFWWTIGLGKKECEASYGDLYKYCNFKAPQTIKNNIDKLIKKRCVKLLDRGFAKKSKYRVYSPLEILTPDKNDNDEVKKLRSKGGKKNVKGKATKTKDK